LKIIDIDNIPQMHTEGHSSKGDQPKWNFGGKWYKADYMGYESLSEVVISRLLHKSSVIDFVEYSPVMIKTKGKSIPGCESTNFRAKNEYLVPFERLHRIYYGKGLAKALAEMPTAGERIKYTVDFIENVTGISNAGAYITMLLELDAFFLNEDRHTNNLAVIRNENSKEYHFCPVFDNGLALLSDKNDYPVDSDIYECISRVNAKPFDVNFDEQLFAAEELYGAQVRFEFKRKDVLEALEDLSEIYSADIIERVEKVLLEQMRKYQVLLK